MSLTPGTRLGPYEIVAPIGSGGMGEVYKARDTRLDRVVAVKILNAQIAAGTDARERFEREARVISQLSHPHICPLFDVGDERSTAFLVMEYLEGETLTDRLRKTPLTLTETLRFGIEIAGVVSGASMMPTMPPNRRRRARSSAPFNTCRRSTSKEKRPTRARTSLRSAPYCSKWPLGAKPSRARRRPA
jgi:serine/threonine protein kinase